MKKIKHGLFFFTKHISVIFLSAPSIWFLLCAVLKETNPFKHFLCHSQGLLLFCHYNDTSGNIFMILVLHRCDGIWQHSVLGGEYFLIRSVCRFSPRWWPVVCGAVLYMPWASTATALLSCLWQCQKYAGATSSYLDLTFGLEGGLMSTEHTSPSPSTPHPLIPPFQSLLLNECKSSAALQCDTEGQFAHKVALSGSRDWKLQTQWNWARFLCKHAQRFAI